MGRRKRRKEAKAAEVAEKPKKKRRRLRKLVVLGSLAGGLAAWRQRQLAENEAKFGPR
jgi:chemotaxis response regulator CheB